MPNVQEHEGDTAAWDLHDPDFKEELSRRLRARWRNLVLVHTPIHASWLTRSKSTSPWCKRAGPDRTGDLDADPVHANLEAPRGMRSAGGGLIGEDHHAEIRVHVRKM